MEAPVLLRLSDLFHHSRPLFSSSAFDAARFTGATNTSAKMRPDATRRPYRSAESRLEWNDRKPLQRTKQHCDGADEGLAY